MIDYFLLLLLSGVIAVLIGGDQGDCFSHYCDVVYTLRSVCLSVCLQAFASLLNTIEDN